MPLAIQKAFADSERLNWLERQIKSGPGGMLFRLGYIKETGTWFIQGGGVKTLDKTDLRDALDAAMEVYPDV